MVNLETAEIRDYVNSSEFRSLWRGTSAQDRQVPSADESRGKESEELAVQEIASELRCYAEKGCSGPEHLSGHKRKIRFTKRIVHLVGV